jgi:hypothetical protein
VLGRESTTVDLAVNADQHDEEEDGAEPAPAGKMRIKRWLSWSHAWAQEIVLERRKSIVSKLRDLQDVGELTILPSGAMAENGLPADIAAILEIVCHSRRGLALLRCSRPFWSGGTDRGIGRGRNPRREPGVWAKLRDRCPAGMR